MTLDHLLSTCVKPTDILKNSHDGTEKPVHQVLRELRRYGGDGLDYGWGVTIIRRTLADGFAEDAFTVLPPR